MGTEELRFESSSSTRTARYSNISSENPSLQQHFLLLSPLCLGWWLQDPIDLFLFQYKMQLLLLPIRSTDRQKLLPKIYITFAQIYPTYWFWTLTFLPLNQMTNFPLIIIWLDEIETWEDVRFEGTGKQSTTRDMVCSSCFISHSAPQTPCSR